MSAAGSKRRAGLSYVEVVAAALVLSLALVPAIQSLELGLLGSDVQQSAVAQHYRLKGRMEEMLAEPFAALAAEAIAVGDPSVPTSYSDSGSKKHRLLVFLSLYDGDDADGDADPFTGVDAGLVWIRVAMTATPHALESLTKP